MGQKAQYQTKQMAELLAFLESVRGSHVTVNDICAYFKSRGVNIGTTTVYRHLERMVSQGIVAKYTIDGTSSACFEYLGADDHAAHAVCFHCKCESCGKVIHLQCQEAEALGAHMLEHHDFLLNACRTVFYGLCSECRNK